MFASRPHDGTIEFVKWIALAAMIVDHVGALLFDQGKSSLAYQIGRLAFPLFAFVLAYKLSIKAVDGSSSSLRTVKRLFLWALISFVPFYLAVGRLWTPNIFFTLGLGALACWVSISPIGEWHKWLAYLGIFAASFGCDYFAPGVFLILSVYVLYRWPSLQAAAAVVLCCAAIAFLTWSLWALLAIPIAAATHGIRVNVPRLKWFFYAVYPLHLLAIALVARSGLLP
ncbi:MAG: TraX family protein [Burkholderiales bacterium]